MNDAAIYDFAVLFPQYDALVTSMALVKSFGCGGGATTDDHASDDHARRNSAVLSRANCVRVYGDVFSSAHTRRMCSISWFSNTSSLIPCRMRHMRRFTILITGIIIWSSCGMDGATPLFVAVRLSHILTRLFASNNAWLGTLYSSYKLATSKPGGKPTERGGAFLNSRSTAIPANALGNMRAINVF